MGTHWSDRARNIWVITLVLAALTLAYDYGQLVRQVGQLESHRTPTANKDCEQ